MKKDKNPKPEKKKRRSLREQFNAAFGSLRWKDVRGIGKETLKDMRNPKEILTFAASSFVPGGWLGYAFYRVVKYRKGQGPSNDNGGQDKPPENKPPGP